MIQAFQKMWKFGKVRQKTLVEALIFSFAKGIFLMLQMYAIMFALQVLTGNIDVKQGEKTIIILMLVCLAGIFFCSYFAMIRNAQAGFYMAADKRIAIGNLLKNIPLGFFSNSSTGKISAVLTTTLSDVESMATTALMSVFGGFLGSVALAVGLFVYEWKIAVLTVIGMAVYLVVVKWQMQVSKKDAPSRMKAQNELTAAAISFFQGIKVTKSFSCKDGDFRMKKAIEGSRNENLRLTDRAMPSQVVSQLSMGVFEVLIFMAAYMLYQQNAIGVDKMIVLMIISFMAYGSLNQAGSTLSMFGMLDAAMEDIAEIESTMQLEILEPKEHIQSSEIRFENVSFSYGDNEVLHNISTVIEPGTCTAVIGPSGSGKSTFCQLISRFWEIEEGTIHVGGADIRHVETKELMSQISMVFQRVYLFEDTILNNIRFGKPDATLEEVRAAAKAARCDEFIMSLPNGYDTRIEEGGNNFSGGEKQRISIARAILKNAPIVILDEATSALDPENEHDILNAISELTKNKTVIMIAHRMNTLQAANHIIALENGTIKQEGTPEQLLKEDGIYKRFMQERLKAAAWKVR